MLISVAITAHNEGDEVRRTIESVQRSCAKPVDITLVDDGSTDECCVNCAADRVHVVRHERRIGVAYSRDRAVDESFGDVLVFLDAHQRLSSGCLELCAEVAKRHNSIVWPDVRGFSPRSRKLHGATFQLCPRHGYFTARWRLGTPAMRTTRISSLRCPGYVMPRSIYERVRWIQGLRNWGGSEASISLKAFFLDIPILHLCGPVARHMFKKRLNYDASWDDVWRNQAMICRICFDDTTWHEYWRPKVFGSHLTREAQEDLESDIVIAQHEEFQKQKLRTDREFWTELIRRRVPACLR